METGRMLRVAVLVGAWLAFAPPPAEADLIGHLDRPIAARDLTAFGGDMRRSIFSDISGTLSGAGASGNWAERELASVRGRGYTEYTAPDFGGWDEASAPGVDFGTDDVAFDAGDAGPGEALALTEDGGARDALWGQESAFADALSEVGLGVEEIGVELPLLARDMATYVAFFNDSTLRLVLELRLFLRGDARLKAAPAPDAHITIEERQERAMSAGRVAAGDTGNKEEDSALQTTRKVVRSALKIALGFCLGFLLWSFVRRI